MAGFKLGTPIVPLNIRSSPDELRFIADGKNATRVELEHRRLDLYGARRDEMRRVFDTEGDWGRLLEAFAQAARAASA